MTVIVSHSPAQILAQLLIDLGLGNAPTTGGNQPSWPVVADNEPKSPDNTITVTDTTSIIFDGDSHGGRNEFYGFQVKIRSGTHSIGWPKAKAIATAMDTFKAQETVVVNGTSYCVGQIIRASGPLRLGPEAGNSRRAFTVNGLAYIVLSS